MILLEYAVFPFYFTQMAEQSTALGDWWVVYTQAVTVFHYRNSFAFLYSFYFLTNECISPEHPNYRREKSDNSEAYFT